MSVEWYTPSHIIEAARTAMGSISLDPASCELANTVVKASKFYTAQQDGLIQRWHGNVWLNPPFKSGLCSDFIRKALLERDNIEQACILVPISLHTKWLPDFLGRCDAFCWIIERVHFWGGDKDNGFSSPILVVYLGECFEEFCNAFGFLGPTFYPT